MSITKLLQVIDQNCLPVKSDSFAYAEFVQTCQISEDRAKELIALEFVTPIKLDNNELLFNKKDVEKTLKLVRICKDFELNDFAGTIIIDLLEKVSDLESKLKK